jgi:hypothetical protein
MFSSFCLYGFPQGSTALIPTNLSGLLYLLFKNPYISFYFFTFSKLFMKEDVRYIETIVKETNERITFFWNFMITYLVVVVGWLLTKRENIHFSNDKIETAKLFLVAFHLCFVYLNVMALHTRYQRLQTIYTFISTAGIETNSQFEALLLENMKRELKAKSVMRYMLWVFQVCNAIMMSYLILSLKF